MRVKLSWAAVVVTLFDPHSLHPNSTALPDWIVALGNEAVFAERPLAHHAPSTSSGPCTSAGQVLEDDAFEKGRLAGIAEAQARAADDAKSRSGLTTQLSQLDEAMLAEISQHLRRSVAALCEQILGDYAVDMQALETRCFEAAKKMSTATEALILRLHPLDIAELSSEFTDQWQLIPDEGIERGSIQLEGPDSILCEGPVDWRRAIAEALQI